MNGLTTTETRLAEQYVSVLDYVSRCAQASTAATGSTCTTRPAPSPRKPSGWPCLPARPTTPPAALASRRWGRRWPGSAATTGPPACCTPSTRGPAMIARAAAPSRPRWWAGRPGRGHGPGGAGRPPRQGGPRPGRRRAPRHHRPKPPAPRPTTRPQGADLHQRRWLPTRRRLPLPASGPPRPHGAGRRRRPLPASGVVPAQRPFLVRQGHPPGLQPQRLARRRRRPGRRPPGQPLEPRRPPARASGSAGAGPGSSRARSAPPGPSAAGPGSPTPATKGTCMSASPARPRPGGAR